jgi:hypothetical protein
MEKETQNKLNYLDISITHLNNQLTYDIFKETHIYTFNNTQ